MGGLGFPLGPDAPVYLWWIRLAGLEGLSVVGPRPGTPALALAVGGALGLSEVATVAALQGALGVAVGLASAALIRAGGVRRAGWVLAGVLSGTFAVHLAAGYLANLAFTAAFLAAASMLAGGNRTGVPVAGGVLAAGGLAHPPFFVVGAVVLLLSAALAWRVDRVEALRVASATVGAGALVGLGLVALLAGPEPLAADTSKDAFLRRAGLGGELRSAYLDRFVHRWTRYVQWASIPLAVAGLGPATGFVGRFLRSWGVVTVVGVGISLATGIAPADRFVTFGFVVPMLAALGLLRVWDALGSRTAVAAVAVGALMLAMLAGAWIAWGRQEPFLSALEVRRVTDAGPWLGRDPSAALVFPVNDDDPAVTFLATRAANVIRAAVPPERIRDVAVVVPAPRGPADVVRRSLTRVSLEDAARAVARHDGRRLDVLLAPFDRVDLPDATGVGSPWRRVSTGVFLSPGDAGRGPVGSSALEASSPAGIAAATLTMLILLGAVGYGWARAAGTDAAEAAAISPAVGAATITIVAIALERCGVALDGSWPAGALVSAVAGGSGYAVRLVLERRARARPAPQVEQQP